MLKQQQNLERRFGTSKMYLSPQWLPLLSVLKRAFCLDDSLFIAGPIVCGALWLVLILLFSTLSPSSFAIILFPDHTHLLFIAMVSSLLASDSMTTRTLNFHQ